jgi:hypothetical protein
MRWRDWPYVFINAPCPFQQADRQCLPCEEVCCSQPSKESAGSKTQMSSQYDSPSYVSNQHVHEDLEVPFFTYHIRRLTESFNSVVSNTENPKFGHSKVTCSNRGLTKVAWDFSQKRLEVIRTVVAAPKMAAKSTLRNLRRIFRVVSLRSSVNFPMLNANTTVWLKVRTQLARPIPHPSCEGLQPKYLTAKLHKPSVLATEPLWIQALDMHLTKVLVPQTDTLLFVTEFHITSTSRPSTKTENPLAYAA